MRRGIVYSPQRRQVAVRVPANYRFRRKLLHTLRREGLVQLPFAQVSARQEKYLVLNLAPHGDLPTSNLLERLAFWLSHTSGHRTVHAPWERGGRPVDIDLAVELIVDAVLNFDESKLEACPA